MLVFCQYIVVYVAPYHKYIVIKGNCIWLHMYYADVIWDVNMYVSETKYVYLKYQQNN